MNNEELNRKLYSLMKKNLTTNEELVKILSRRDDFDYLLSELESKGLDKFDIERLKEYKPELDIAYCFYAVIPVFD